MVGGFVLASDRAMNGTPLLSKWWRSFLIALCFYLKNKGEAPYRVL
jgi:hypothetical protein